MCKFNPKSGNKRIDPCMKKVCQIFEKYSGCKVLMCCCGHGKYHRTLIYREKDKWHCGFPIIELYSGIELFRKKRFYKKDKQGYYYIPEVVKK